MSKDAIISEILAMPEEEQMEILSALQARWGDEVFISNEQEDEMERRLERFEREGPRGDPWEVVEKRLLRGPRNAPPAD